MAMAIFVPYILFTQTRYLCSICITYESLPLPKKVINVFTLVCLYRTF